MEYYKSDNPQKIEDYKKVIIPKVKNIEKYAIELLEISKNYNLCPSSDDASNLRWCTNEILIQLGKIIK